MGSETDLPVMQQAVEPLREAKVPFEIQIVSAHRTPEEMQKYALNAHKRGIKVIIAGAGGAAHLPGMVASLTHLPVIGVPIQVGKLKGLDALLSIAQMPRGVPVATVAVDNAANAGILALRILATSSKRLTAWLIRFRTKMKSKVKKSRQRLKDFAL